MTACVIFRWEEINFIRWLHALLSAEKKWKNLLDNYILYSTREDGKFTWRLHTLYCQKEDGNFCSLVPYLAIYKEERKFYSTATYFVFIKEETKLFYPIFHRNKNICLLARLHPKTSRYNPTIKLILNLLWLISAQDLQVLNERADTKKTLFTTCKWFLPHFQR